MGYTHYFTRQQVKIPKPTFEKILADFKKVIPKIDADLGDPHGEHTEPILTADEICFNGMDGDAHETMCLPRDYTGRRGYPNNPHRTDMGMFDFCKTARKPYDIAVCALLIITKHHLGSKIEVDSDGNLDDPEEWLPAVALVKNELGIKSDGLFD